MVDTATLLKRSAVKHITNLNRINIIAANETSKVLSVLPDMTFNEQASFVRNTIPTVISKYGDIAAVVGSTYYDEVREIQSNVWGYKPYTAKIPTAFNFDDAIYNMLGFSIAENSKYGVSTMTKFLVDEMTLHVSNYDRETISYNAENDVVECTIQRVAEAKACSFCLTLAVNDVTYTGSYSKLSGITEYDNKWHSNCNCISTPIFKGMNAIRPDYYDKFDKDYQEAKKLLSSGEAGSRVIKQGTDEYQTIVGKDITAASRDFRKGSPMYKKMSTEEKAKYRTNLENKAKNIAYKLNNNIPLTDLDNTILKNWGYTVPEQVTKPLVNSTKDVLYLLRKDFNYN